MTPHPPPAPPPNRTILVRTLAVSVAASLQLLAVPEGPFIPPGIGAWDGVTASAELARPYEDPSQAEVPFGTISYYKDGWRAYMDTWSAARFAHICGFNWTDLDLKEIDATMQLFREHGFRHVRIEVGWCSFTYDDPQQMERHRLEKLTRVLAAAKKYGVRPLILLNGNSGMPTPQRERWATLAEPASAGATTLVFTGEVPPFKLGRTGLERQDLWTAYPLVTALASDGGVTRATLSAPLVKALPAGRLLLRELKYAPFAGDTFADGTPNPDCAETLQGWTDYVAAVTSLASRLLGTVGADDAGFDLEVWNEYSFGSHFLHEKHYYKPARAFAHFPEYREGEHQINRDCFSEIILPLTIHYVNDPAHKLPKVNVVSGFSNQRPWENGTEMWHGQAGFSRHYYSGFVVNDTWGGIDGLLSPATESKRSLERDPIDNDGKGDRTKFVPTFRAAAAEIWCRGYKTETMSRDLQPFPNPMKGHGRYGHPGDGRAPLLWETEYNSWRRPFAESLERAYNLPRNDARLDPVLDAMAAKAFLRSSVFYCHKGLDTLFYYSACSEWDEFGLVPPSYRRTLAEDGYKLTDRVRAAAGSQLRVAAALDRLLGTVPPLDATRPLTVDKLVEHRPRLVFKGAGTSNLPDLFHRDDFVCLPFQLDARSYAIGYYVATRNMIHPWDPSKELLDPARYAMPDQRFDVTFGNLCGEGAELSAFDPMTGKTEPLAGLAASATSLTVALPTTDYPRFLVVRERAEGPLVQAPRLVRRADGRVEVSFVSAGAGEATVEWGPFPSRKGAARTLAVKPGEVNRVLLDDVKPGTAVRVRIEANGLASVWPRWDHDTAGVFTGQ